MTNHPKSPTSNTEKFKQSTTEETLEPCPWCAAMPQPFKHHQIVEHKPICFLSTFGTPVAEHIYAPKYNAWNTRVTASAAPVVDEPHKRQKWVYSKDVMEALANAFDSMKGQTLPVSEVGYAVYKALLAVPEFSAAATAAPVEQSELAKLRQAVGWICDAADAAYNEDANNERIHEIFNIAAKAAGIKRRLPDEHGRFDETIID